MTPSLAIVKIRNASRNPGSRGFGLWIPLFLLWIPIVLLAPLILLVALAVCMAKKINPWRAIGAFWAVSSSLSGTDVDVSAPNSRILVRLL